MATNKRHPLLRYLRYAKPYRWTLALMIVAGIATFTLPLIPAKAAKILTDRVILNRGGLDEAARHRLLAYLAGAFFGAEILRGAARYLRGVATVKTACSMVFDIRQSLWRHLQRLGLGFHQSRPTGSILSRLMSDISVSQRMVNSGIANVFVDGVSACVALAVLVSISWQMTLLVLLVLPGYGILYRKINPRIRQASRDVQEQTAVMSGVAVERLNGIALVQSFAQEPAEAEYFAEQADELRDRSVRRGRLNHTLRASSEFLVSMAAHAVWIVGALLAIGAKVSPGQIIEFTMVVALLYRPIRRFSQINIVYQNSMAAIERVFAIFDVVPEVKNRPNVPDRVVGLGGVALDRVWFRYEEDARFVLHDVSFQVAPGERVAIVGESGAGKSTLVTLIPRLYDVTEGAIRIDGIDIRDYRYRRLRRGIGIVLQDTILFSGTVRENLRYGQKGATDAEIIEAAKAANAHQFICELPGGYDTGIGERGMTLSGGQRQRISLARALLQSPRILILDEATSSLDSESENLITEALERVMAGRTCLIIAHRLSTVMGADRIVVLREGRLVESGGHVELLAANGYYRYLFEQQFGPLQDLLAQAHGGGER